MALVAGYKLDGNTNDNVGLSPITVTTAFTYTTGKFGQAGIGSGYWPAATTASILNNNALSFSFGIYVTGNGDAGVIFGRDPMTPPNNRKFTFFQYPTINDLHLSWQNDDTGVFIGGAWYGVFPTGQGTHCAITYNNPTCKIYINGTLIYTGSGVSNSASFAFDTPVFYNSTARYIDDFKVYTHALSEAEIKRLAGEQKSLVAHYKLDGNANDSSTNNLHGTISGATYTTAGMFKGAYTFANTRIYSVDMKNHIKSNAGTGSAGVKRSSSQNSFNMFMGQGLPYFAFLPGGSFIGSANISGTQRTVGTSETYLDNKWYHFAATYDGTFMKIFIDGIEKASASGPGTISHGGDMAFAIGDGANYTGYPFYGTVDDVRIYNYALDESKIKELAMPKILHYKFDSDYEEATQNYIYHQNPRIDLSYAPYVATTSGTGQAKHPDAIRVYNQIGSEITGYVNSGVTDGTNTYHAIWVFDDQLSKPVVKMKDISSPGMAKSFGIGQSMNSLGLSIGSKYTISGLQKVTDLGKYVQVGLYGQNSSAVNGFHDGQSNNSITSRNTKINTGQRVYHTFTVGSAWNMNTSLNCYMYGEYGTNGATSGIADVQLETKDHPTGFVNGSTRTGAIIKDHSLAENHGTVDLTYTPKGIKSDISYGLMDFNYTKQHYISVPNFIPENKQAITIMVGVKSNDITKSQNIFSRNGPFFMRITSSTLRLGFYTGTGVFANGATTLESNKGYHLAITYDGIKAKGYVNGMLDIDVAKTGDLLSGSSTIRVGYTTGGEDAPMDGQIDELKVYYKALSQEEIQNEMNNVSKQIYYDKDLTSSKILMEPNKGSMEF